MASSLTNQAEQPQAGTPRFSQTLRIVAVLTACCVFPLILVGAGVTSTDSGMAFPDWPTSDGHLVNPPNWWDQSDTRWEHGHRLIGWVVGMLAMALALLSWRRRGAMRILGIATLLAIGIQGVVGGLRVTEISTVLALVHGIWGQVCFCLAAAAALVSSRMWTNAGEARALPAASMLRKLVVMVTGAIVMQLGFGAALRHFGGTHALIVHLLFAIVVVLLVGWLVMWVLSLPAEFGFMRAVGGYLGVFMIGQLMLGGAAFLIVIQGAAASSFVQWLIPTAHVGVGALLLVCSLYLTMSARRFVTGTLAGQDLAESVRVAPS